MFHFLKLQYKLGKITKEELHKLVPKHLTEMEYEKIVSGVSK